MSQSCKHRIDIAYHGRPKVLVATRTGLKIGTRGRVQDPGVVLSMLDKGSARRVRKFLRSAGFTALAAAKRARTYAEAAAVGLSGLSLL